MHGKAIDITTRRAEPAARFTVSVLGPFGVTRDGEALDTALWSRRGQTLLKLLATTRDGRYLRDEAIEVLWPGAAPQAGPKNLRYVLHVLRRDLGGGSPPPILSEREWVSLCPQYDWDVDLLKLETAATVENPSTLEQALQLYRGEPLVEDRYEDWAAPIRERAQRSWRAASLRLAKHYREHERAVDAATLLENLLEHDPVDEEALQELLQAFDASGRRADALRRFQQFEQRLSDEIGLQPSPETLSTVDQLRSRSGISLVELSVEAARQQPLPIGGYLGALPSGPLVARDDELDRILFVADAVKTGMGRIVVLAGEAGVGKTRLAQEAMICFRDSGFQVLTGRCSERGAEAALTPFREALPAVFAALQGHRLRPSDEISSAEQLDVCRQIADYLVAIAEERPVALLLDDLQWADEASLTVFQQLGHQTRPYRVIVLAVYRDADVDRGHPLWRALRELDREGLVERIAVRRLTAEGTAALVAATVEKTDDAGEFAEFVHRRTKGDPFYIIKMLRALGGRYRLVRQIGAGGMGRVFEALDTQTGGRVAAKIMFARTEADPRALQRFEQEGAVLATLSHPNIVQVHGSFIEEHASCIIMELLEGQTLGRLIEEHDVDLRRLQKLSVQIAAALACAHERGIAHRDIKPDNIMVLTGDLVKVTDFGIARLLRPDTDLMTMTSTGMTMGTPLYMAPEQIEGKKVDSRTDIYALGAVLYRAVAGRPPFLADDPLSVAIKHLQEEPLPPSQINPALPLDWNALILKALAKDPAERYQTSAALESALSTLPVDGVAIPSRGAKNLRSFSPAGRQTARSAVLLLDRYVRTFPLRAMATVLVVLALLATVVLKTYSSSSPASSVLGRFAGSWALPPMLAGPFQAPASIAVDASGTMYVLDSALDRVTKLARNGTPLSSWGRQGSGPGELRNPQSMALDAHGNIYVADTGNDRIEKFSSTGRLLASWGQTGDDPGQYRAPGGVAIDTRGFIYVSDTANNRVQMIDPNGHPVPTAVGTFTAFFQGLNHPKGIAVDAHNNVFVANNGNNQIVKFAPEGVSIDATWSTAGDPTGIALDTQGSVFVTDVAGSIVQKLSARTGSAVPVGPQNPQLRSPAGIAVDTQGNVYLADTGNGRILTLSAQGRWVKAWPSESGPALLPSPDALAIVGSRSRRAWTLVVVDAPNSRILSLSSGRWATARQIHGSRILMFVGPAGGIATGRFGSVFITDYGGGHVVKLNAKGELVALWGSTGSGPALTYPQGIAMDSRGNLYVADQGNGRIQKFSPNGTLTALWPIPKAGKGTGSCCSQPYPFGVAVDSLGFVYLTDEYNDHIVKLSPSGSPVAVWGSAGSGQNQLRAPEGIALDPHSGYIYVADTGNNRIQIRSSTGQVLEDAGMRGSGPGQFIRPAAVAVDSLGGVYVADTGNHRVQVFTP